MGKIKEIFDKFVEDGVLTRDEHDLFIEQIHADGKIDEEEKGQISRMFALIKEGKLQIVDSEREKFEIMKKKEALQKAIQAKK